MTKQGLFAQAHKRALVMNAIEIGMARAKRYDFSKPTDIQMMIITEIEKVVNYYPKRRITP